MTHDTWVALASRLGRLHSADVTGWPEVRTRRWPSADEVGDALRLWRGRGSASLASRAAAQLATVREVEAGLGRVLSHGDCHVGNLLRAPDGRTLWTDWQEVCLTTGLDDLVFLWQRAEFAGAHPPRAAMTVAYGAARGLALTGVLRAALVACELRLLLVAWPRFLPLGSPRRQEAMTKRLGQLVDGEARG